MASNAYPCILYDNRFLDAVPTATNTETGYDVANVTDLREYTWWQADASGTIYVTVNCGSPKAADSLAVIGHNLFTATATVSVEWSANGADWTECLAGFTPADDKAFFKTWVSASKQYWRLKIVTGAVAARIAVLLIGARLDFTRYPSGDFDPDGEEIVADSSISKAGYLLGSTIRFYQRAISAKFNNLTPTWIHDTFLPAYVAHLSLLKPFFFVWDRTNHADEVFYGCLQAGNKLSVPYSPYRRSLALDMIGRREV